MELGGEPFIGSEALAAGHLSRHELRTYYRVLMRDVYIDKRVPSSLSQRTAAAWLWSRREAVITGAAAAALLGSKWVDDAVPVELIWRNARSPQGIVTRADLLLSGEFDRRSGLLVATPERAAFDIGRRLPRVRAVAALDALAAATGFKTAAVQELADNHHRARGLRQLESALDLVDPGAQSPKETWLRLQLISAGFPRPQTQIAVPGGDGFPRYFLDMGWEDIRLAVEYDGGQHWTDPQQYADDITRHDYLAHIGWTVIRVASRHRAANVINRVRRAWVALTPR